MNIRKIFENLAIDDIKITDLKYISDTSENHLFVLQKKEKRALDNWRRIVKRLIIMERLKRKFAHHDEQEDKVTNVRLFFSQLAKTNDAQINVASAGGTRTQAFSFEYCLLHQKITNYVF